MKRISRSNLGLIQIGLPPLEEQQQITDYLDKKCAEIDKLIAIKQQKIETLTEYKKSLIYEYVTGKKEVVSWVLTANHIKTMKKDYIPFPTVR